MQQETTNLLLELTELSTQLSVAVQLEYHLIIMRHLRPINEQTK
ncbi:MAG: hypothetical protein AAFP93_03030 [Bacteroidota bacterium]